MMSQETQTKCQGSIHRLDAVSMGWQWGIKPAKKETNSEIYTKWL